MNFHVSQELALHRGLGHYLLFAARDSLISANQEEIMIISLLGKKNRKSQYFNLNLYLISRHSASGALCLHHHSTTFPIFFHGRQKMLVNKRRNSDPAAGDNPDFNITDRENSYGTFLICYYMMEFLRTWGLEGSVSRRMVKIYIYKLSFDDLY